MQDFAALILIYLVNQPECEFWEDWFNIGVGQEKAVMCVPEGMKISECSKYSNQPTFPRGINPI